MKDMIDLGKHGGWSVVRRTAADEYKYTIYTFVMDGCILASVRLQETPGKDTGDDTPRVKTINIYVWSRSPEFDSMEHETRVHGVAYDSSAITQNLNRAARFMLPYSEFLQPWTGELNPYESF